MNDSMKLVFGLIVVFLVILIGPAILIWSLNTLFGLSIAYTAKNLFASFLLLVLLNGRVEKK